MGARQRNADIDVYVVRFSPHFSRSSSCDEKIAMQCLRMGSAHDYEDMTCMFWDAHGGFLFILVISPSPSILFQPSLRLLIPPFLTCIIPKNDISCTISIRSPHDSSQYTRLIIFGLCLMCRANVNFILQF